MELGDNTLNNERPLLVNVVVQFFFWLKFFLNQFKIFKPVLLFYTSLICPNLCLWQRTVKGHKYSSFSKKCVKFLPLLCTLSTGKMDAGRAFGQ